MAALSLDNEFMQYWSQLNLVEKESLMTVAKNYVQQKDAENLHEVRKKLVLNERAAYLQGEGKSYSWEQVKEMALNKDKRNAL